MKTQVCKVSKVTTLNNDSSLESFKEFSYYPEGKVKTIITYNKHFKPIRKESYEYDQFDRGKSYKVYAGTFGKKLYLIYDKKILSNEKGNTIRVEIINYNLRQTEVYTYEYK